VEKRITGVLFEEYRSQESELESHAIFVEEFRVWPSLQRAQRLARCSELGDEKLRLIPGRKVPAFVELLAKIIP
jgi:hypothetical protein